MKRMLNIAYGIEVLDGRLNGSCEEVERSKDGYKNTTFTKKIGGRGKVSAVCQKRNMRDYLVKVLGENESIKTKDGKQVIVASNPYQNLIDDVFGFMMAGKLEISQEEYNALDEDEKKLYKKNKKVYTSNITKKRTSNLQMSSLINVSNRRVETEFGVCSTSGDSMPYKLETYSGIMSGIANFNISGVGEYNVTDVESEFRDYATKEAEVLGVRNLNKNEKIERITKVLRALEYMSIKGNQTNHLTDTKPKFVILADYGWGNNVFQGVINGNGLDVEMFKEALEQNEEYRLGKVRIGVNKFFDKNFDVDIEKLKEEFKEYDFIEVDNVHNTFNNYIEDLRNIIE